MCAYIIMSVFMVANMKAKGTPMEHSSVPLTEGLFTVGREHPPHDLPNGGVEQTGSPCASLP